mmetsp:Transcript_18612/g.27596  ORF Transcript_18612/g.27596 Transcript_18612/m.27596 type:complete len:391 (+) Transcript_18612:80-1252(+)
MPERKILGKVKDPYFDHLPNDVDEEVQWDAREKTGLSTFKEVQGVDPTWPPPQGTVFNQHLVNGSDKFNGPFAITSGHPHGMALYETLNFYFTSFRYEDRGAEQLMEIPIFWASGRPGQVGEDKVVKNNKSPEIPEVFTVSANNDVPVELVDSIWSDFEFREGYATLTKDAGYRFLVVIHKEFQPFQKRFRTYVDESLAFKLAELAAGLAGDNAALVGIGLTTVYATTGASILISAAPQAFSKTADLFSGQYLVPLFHSPEQMKPQGPGLSVEESVEGEYDDGYTLDDASESQLGQSGITRDTKERIQDIEEEMGNMLSVLSKIEESMNDHSARSRERMEKFQQKIDTSISNSNIDRQDDAPEQRDSIDPETGSVQNSIDPEIGSKQFWS